MSTNKDQAQAHQSMMQRVVSALTVHETDPEQPPFRRPTMAAIGGIVIGILVMAGFWVFGLIVPGGKQFEATDVVAVEEETGARFVLLNGRLHPVLNYTSALLALDKHAAVDIVPRASLAGLPVGPPIGIPGAPDSLPGKDQLLTDAWSMCDQSTVDGDGRRTDTPTLLVGQALEQGRPLNNDALLVHSGERMYVVHDGYRHEISAKVDVALELETESPVSVNKTWLDTLPAGRPIGPVLLENTGRSSTAVPGMNLRSGQVLEVDDGSTPDGAEKRYYLVAGDQLQPISPMQAMIQRVLIEVADPPVVVSNQDLVDASRVGTRPPAENDPPWDRPRFMAVDDPNATVCATFAPGTTVPSVVVGASLPASVLTTPDGEVRVAVPSGRGALIEVMLSGPGQPSGQGTIALVTDQGRLYPLADPGHVMQVFGFDGVAPVRITAALADRVPRAQSLSPEAARFPAAEG
jgi:type VII secretion protein EccB